MASPGKRCYYEVLGLGRDCTADEIRSAYRRLALQRHPDKLAQSGVSPAEATAAFQELAAAYEVISDPRERAWYDSHRSRILFSNSTPDDINNTFIPDLFPYFNNSAFSGFSDTGKGFYKVYSDLFEKIYRNEVSFANKLGLRLVKEAPLLGNIKSDYSQVNAFYGYWLSFVTVMDFVWVDQFDAMNGINRKSRRVMEEENKKARKKARREFNETVRGLAEFVKKRDKRVIDMQVRRNEEVERRREEEKERRRQMARERAEQVRAYEEPEWSKVEEVEGAGVEEEEEEEGKKKGDESELYCVVCGKKFKSDKQWKNHEQSKKHKEKVAEFREACGKNEGEGEKEDKWKEEEVLVSDVDGNGFVSADDGVDDLTEKLEKGVGVEEQEDSENHESESSEEEGLVDIDNGVADKLGSDDDDATGILDAMISKSKKKLGQKQKQRAPLPKFHDEVDSNEVDFMEYDNRKSTRRNRGGRRQKGRGADVEAEGDAAAEIKVAAEEKIREDDSKSTRRNKGRRRQKGRRADDEAEGEGAAEISSQADEKNGEDDGSHAEESSSSQYFAEYEGIGNEDERLGSKPKASKEKQAADKIYTTKMETSTKSKNASKGRKQKGATSKSSGHVCERCGEDFESRNRLHKHLSDTDHASLKSR
ncbi:hypothetical protein RJ639_030663 [Escallonia herrerae]|uniref:Uncharacterized protein n=1 Tax=Escallonia herrerae TaxID=1293975 RepID=A0AA88X6Z6_9ASTE|nr:hypothetical protein RJ639_030663 [Escallonia herrerae]